MCGRRVILDQAIPCSSARPDAGPVDVQDLRGAGLHGGALRGAGGGVRGACRALYHAHAWTQRELHG
ncbi:hypothetical protein GQ600_13884 [Phytophthora cactorum]|nr:hypothetical protein GQ600_13884 [Phytophthora cactorum]